MATHKVRSWKHLFQPMIDGIKTHDLRVDDREYKVGDFMQLQEYDIEAGAYTGREALFEITYITGRGSGQSPCAVSTAVLHPAYVILSVRKVVPPENSGWTVDLLRQQMDEMPRVTW